MRFEGSQDDHTLEAYLVTLLLEPQSLVEVQRVGEYDGLFVGGDANTLVHGLCLGREFEWISGILAQPRPSFGALRVGYEVLGMI